MTRSTEMAGASITLAFSVAKLTLASTPSSAFSCFSIRAAHAPQVIPPTTQRCFGSRLSRLDELCDCHDA